MKKNDASTIFVGGGSVLKLREVRGRSRGRSHPLRGWRLWWPAQIAGSCPAFVAGRRGLARELSRVRHGDQRVGPAALARAARPVYGPTGGSDLSRSDGDAREGLQSHRVGEGHRRADFHCATATRQGGVQAPRFEIE